MIGSILGAICQGFIWGIMVLGVYITYKVLKVSDLTVDGSFATGGCVYAMLVLLEIDSSVALFISFLAGAICGCITGLIHTKFKIPAILSGILTQLGLYSINLRILGDKANVSISKFQTNISFVSKTLNITQSNAGLLVGLIFSIILITLIYFLLGTELGSAIRATGNNPQMIRSLGVNTDRMIVYGIIFSNALIALSGALLTQMNKYADVSMGKGAIVYGLAAIVIGEVIFMKFQNFYLKLTSSVIGCVLFFIIRAMVIRLGLKANDMQLISAIIVILALAFPEIKKYINNLKQNNGGGK